LQHKFPRSFCGATKMRSLLGTSCAVFHSPSNQVRVDYLVQRDTDGIVMDRFAACVTKRRVLLLVAAMTLRGRSLNAEESPAGTIETLRGEAFAEGPKPRRALQPTAEIFIGDLVETAINSALTMHLGKTTFVKLGALAKFRIDNFVVDAGGTFDLEQGPMLIEHNGAGKSEDLHVRSSFGLIAVRGTMFFAGPSNDVFGVFVGTGVVAVTAGGRTVILRPGLGTNIANPGDAPTEPRRWSPGRIRAALRSVE
jgi:hypothetical protein